MRSAIVLAAVIAATPAVAAPRYVSIGDDAVPDRANILESNAGVDIIQVDDADLDALAQRMHEKFDRCGGFLVHDSLADAEHVAAPRPGPDYSIDRDAIVKPVLSALDKDRIVGTIRALSSAKTRRFDSEGGAQAAAWLAATWRGFTTRSDVSVQLLDHGWAQPAVMLTIKGTTRPDEVVVLGGHLDSISMRGKTADAPGADDDASGIATLTEVVRVLLASDYRPARTIEVIAYDAEEIGLRGSQKIAKDHAKRGVNVVGVLQLDMTAWNGSDKDIWLMKDFTNAAQNTFLTQLIDHYVGATWGLDACGYGCSDHASWYREGYPASMPFETRMRDRNMAIHTEKDTLETSGDNADHAIKFARLAAAYAIEMGKGDADTSGDDSRGWELIALLGIGLALALAPRRL